MKANLIVAWHASMSVDVTPSVGPDSSFQVGPIPHRVNSLKKKYKIYPKNVFTKKITHSTIMMIQILIKSHPFNEQEKKSFDKENYFS